VRLRVSPTLHIAAGLPLAVLLGVVGDHVLHRRIPGSSEALLEQADEKSWVNNWIAAEPLYDKQNLDSFGSVSYRRRCTRTLAKFLPERILD